MENNYIAYKRVKINWWIIILFGGIIVLMIPAYIYQFGDNPLDKAGLIKASLVSIFVCVFLGRFKVIVNDNFAVFRSDIWVPLKIPISMIENISLKKVSMMGMGIPFRDYYFDYSASRVVKIQLKSGKTYQIAIKDAERIKEEIEKRMIKPLFNEK